MNKQQKFEFLNRNQHVGNIELQEIRPDKRFTWLTEGLRAEFESFVPIGSREAKSGKQESVDVVFKTHSLGVNTNRDAWAYNFERNTLIKNIETTIETYNEQVY